jgi:hypothetical protein
LFSNKIQYLNTSTAFHSAPKGKYTCSCIHQRWVEDEGLAVILTLLVQNRPISLLYPPTLKQRPEGSHHLPSSHFPLPRHPLSL